MDIVFSAMVQSFDARTSVLANRFDGLTIGGTFRIPRSRVLFNPDYWPLWEGRPFKCIASAPKAAEEAKYWPISICSAGGGPSTKASQYVEVPQLLSTILPVPNHKASTFLVFNTTGQIEDWRGYLRINGGTGDQEGSASAKQLNWTVSEEGSWDRDDSLYDTALIRDQYMNFGDSRSSPHLRGVLDLHPKSSWEFRDGMKLSEMTDSSQILNYWMLFNSVAGGLHYVNLNGASDKYEVLAGGILLPGAFSPYAVHFAHAA